jgi:hypothetical protein
MDTHLGQLQCLAAQHPADAISKKLSRVYRALHKEKWSIKDLLEVCVRDTDIYGREIILERKSHRTVKSRRRWVAQALNSPYLQAGGLIRQSAPAMIPTYYQELKALRASPEPYCDIINEVLGTRLWLVM